MSDDSRSTQMMAPPPVTRLPEPPLIERARRAGWAMLALSIVAMVVARLGPESLRPWAIAVAATLGLFGLLFIVNVALVRGIYGEIAKARDAAEAAADDQSR
jgi:hypothetical protein